LLTLSLSDYHAGTMAAGVEHDGSSAAGGRGWIDALAGRLQTLPLTIAVVLIASWQVTLRSEDPNGVNLVQVLSILNGTGGDLSQYRVLSYYLAVGLQGLFGLASPPFDEMRFGQCVLIFGLAYVLYGQFGLSPRTRLVGIGLLTGLISLSLGRLGPSTFSLDRFTDTIFYLIAALLVLRGRVLWIPPLMALAVANRETSVFIPTLILARYGPIMRLFTDRRWRTPLFAAIVAWAIGAVVYFGIHAYYGPRPRTEESYFGTAMVLRSLSMPGQTAYFVAMINLLPILALLSLKNADPFLRRSFWLVVPLWFAIHIWAARLGEGIMYLAPTTIIIVPLVLQGLEHSLKPAEPRADDAFGRPLPRP
jgi:uncharacterized membrane protein YagU involved in acid resistance